MPEYRTPGVYIEEISGGPRPVSASSTTETGFVGILTLPTSFVPGRGKAAGLLLPAAEEKALLSWNRALAFRPLLSADDAAAQLPPPAAGGDKKDGAAPAAKPAAGGGSSNKFASLVQEVLPGTWNVQPVTDEGSVTISSDKGATLKIPVRRTMMSIKTDEKGARVWDLSFGADEQQVLQLVAAHAVEQDVKHAGGLRAVDESKKPVTIDISAIQDRLQKTAIGVSSLDSFDQWRYDFGRELFIQLALEADPNLAPARAEMQWDTLDPAARKAWDFWLRSHPGFRRYELSLKGFFENGGKTAFLAMGVQAQGAGGPNKRKFLSDSYDGVAAVAMLAAPGLEFSWQQAILDYAGPKGRGDLFAILEAPRYLLTREPRNVKVDPFRWTTTDAPYEVGVLETVPSPQVKELRFSGYQADEVLDRSIPRDDTGYGAAYAPWLVVENPLSTGPHDKYVIAPPSGHIAGVIAATDLKGGGGVHKAPANEVVSGVSDLVTSISDREQESLNVKNINIIRHRPAAGIRVWGARTVASDPLWRYINVRRLFLFVERSVRDAIQWAVFLPNTDRTRGDLRNTIAGFLYQLYMQGMLDGQTHKDAFTVHCNRDNNPDLDVRSGILTVDVSIRPVYPAEFVRIRFRQSPMQSEVNEG